MTFDPNDVEAAPTATDADLKKVATLANRQTRLERRIERIESLLKTRKEELRIVTEVDLPREMTTAGLKDYTLTDGTKVELREIIRAGIKTEDNPDKDAAFDYLRSDEIGAGDLIKTEFKVLFGKGEEQKAAEFLDGLKENFPDAPYEEKESVNAQTLSAWVREWFTQQEQLPDDQKAPALKEKLLGVYRQRFTKIIAAKKKKVKI